ncbi:hypothetical protein Tco_1557844, partial [Tanacetum coccineum]
LSTDLEITPELYPHGESTLSCLGDMFAFGDCGLLQDREQHVLNVDCYVFSGLLLVTRIVYLLYGSAGVRVVTAAGGRSYKENNRFKRKVATDLEAVMMISRGLGKNMF